MRLLINKQLAQCCNKTGHSFINYKTTTKMKQRIIFPLKFWKQGSMNWFEYEPKFRDELKEFLDNLYNLKYEESWGVINVLNGCFTTIDKDDIETDHCWDKVILTW